MVWLCKLHNHAFEYKFVDIPKGGTRTDEYRRLTPIGKVPILKDGDFTLTEGSVVFVSRSLPLFECLLTLRK